MTTRAERRRAEKRKNRVRILPCRWPMCVSKPDMLHCLSEEVHWIECPRPLLDEVQLDAKKHILDINRAPELDGKECETKGHPRMKQRWEEWNVPATKCPGCGEVPEFRKDGENGETYRGTDEGLE